MSVTGVGRRTACGDRILRAVQTDADLAGRVDWGMVSVDSTSCRAHQHAAGAPKVAAYCHRISDSDH